MAMEREELIRLATETLNACALVLESLTKIQDEPKLIGITQASKMVSRSRVWLRRKLERGELTGYQNGRGGCWQVEPHVLLKELKAGLSKPKMPVRRTPAQRMRG